MSWMTELRDVYDAVTDGSSSTDSKPLPLYHIQNIAQITVVLDGEGNFRAAKKWNGTKEDKKEWLTCMPRTEESEARTASIAPYPLCDKFEYVAGDYKEYLKEKNLEKKDNLTDAERKLLRRWQSLPKKCDKFLEQLEEWCRSPFSDPKIESVLAYVKKGTLIADLIKSKDIFSPKETSTLFSLDEKGNQPKVLAGFVRWEVEIPGDPVPAVWKDTALQHKWICYYESISKGRGLCYACGKDAVILRMHPAKLRKSDDKAKIISADDDKNFTFRGRFHTAQEACQISENVSFKAHNALRWLIEKQGTRVGDGLTFVEWNAAGNLPPPVLCGGMDLYGDEDTEYTTDAAFAAAVNRSLHGYFADIQNPGKNMIMGLNAATRGRMSIVLYREIVQTDFIDMLNAWHTGLAWFYTHWKKDASGKSSLIRTVSTPSPEEIAKAAYGERIKPKQKEKTVERLMSCILDRKPIPKEIECRCVCRASKLAVYQKGFEREQVLNTACAVYKYNHREEGYTVALEENRTDRDYLYGRLLAAADAVERSALNKMKAERDTNAMRYLQRFAARPASTWKMLYEKLNPYKRYLEPGLRNWFESRIREITNLFDAGDYILDEPLSGEYLLGFQCQSKAFYMKKADTDSKTATTETEE